MSLAALCAHVCRVNTQTGHMFQPCSLAKVICASVKSDKWVMWRLWERAVNFYNVLNRNERRARRQAGRDEGRERSGEKWAVMLQRCAVGRGPLSHTVWAPASHLHWQLVCISLRYPAIRPPRAHSRPARQQSWKTQYPVTALSDASYRSCTVSVCTRSHFAVFVKASFTFKTFTWRTLFLLEVVLILPRFVINLDIGWKPGDVFSVSGHDAPQWLEKKM